MTALIEQKLAQGQLAEQIIQSFVAQYGEQVLSAPTKEGFNLVAWVLPFAGLLVGGEKVYVTLKAWVGRGRRSQTKAMAEGGDAEYQQRLEKELEELSVRGFR